MDLGNDTTVSLFNYSIAKRIQHKLLKPDTPYRTLSSLAKVPATSNGKTRVASA